jgi:hypothetical protein
VVGKWKRILDIATSEGLRVEGGNSYGVGKASEW